MKGITYFLGFYEKLPFVQDFYEVHVHKPI